MNKFRVFIGSSSEALPLARRVKGTLEPDFECTVWDDDVFKSNKNVLQTLLDESGLFDFGIMLLTKDDVVVSRKELFSSPRDNALFEFGIFLGRAGDGRAFALVEDGEDMKVPSDLLGVTIRRFKRDTDGKDALGLEVAAGKLAEEMKESGRLGRLGMLSSTVLAIGYFENFVKPVVEVLVDRQVAKIGDEEFAAEKLLIIVPKILDSDIKKRATMYYKSKGLGLATFTVRDRPRQLQAMVDKRKHSAVLCDIPTTLEGVSSAIQMYLHKDYIGKTTRQEMLEAHELRNFRSVLEKLCSSDAYCKEKVSIVEE